MSVTLCTESKIDLSDTVAPQDWSHVEAGIATFADLLQMPLSLVGNLSGAVHTSLHVQVTM